MNAEKRERLEILIGSSVAAVLILLVGYVFSPARIADGSYLITATFTQADGLAEGSTVYASGIPVGQVQQINLDKDYRAVATLRIDNDVLFDDDAAAAIVTDGLFGSKFIQVEVGGGEEDIAPGGAIVHTESAIVLDDLLELIISRARARNAKSGQSQESGQ